MTAFYNEIDPYAAQWLRNLIEAGHIAPGVVDERSIEDIKPDELMGYTQCHFFAGVGVWSLALRRAGWPDNRPVWTGSCPCQPFSAAGAGAGFADPRHLWPSFAWLIKQCAPAVVIGEQVASKAVEPWVDLVHADLEAMGYAFGAVPFPSAGVGAPHIRDRLFWVADSDREPSGQGCTVDGGRNQGSDAQTRPGLGGGSVLDGLDHLHHSGLERHRLFTPHGSANRVRSTARPIGPPGVNSGLADNVMQQRPDGQPGVSNVNDAREWVESTATPSGFCSDIRPGPVNGFWRDVDWLGCRDGKWRPVEPGTFPLAHGAASRVGRLRAYGNAVNAQAAQEFIAAYLESTQGD